MGRVWTLVLLLLLPLSLQAQRAAIVRVALFEDAPRQLLEQAWDSVARDPDQHERAYCLVASNAVNSDLFIVSDVVRPTEVDSSGSAMIAFQCPAHTYRMHVHPPTSCTDRDGHPLDHCVLGGFWAYQCAPSPADKDYTPDDGNDFEAIQCDRDAVIFFRPATLADLKVDLTPHVTEPHNPK